MAKKKAKRDSRQIDELIAKVDKLHDNGRGLSVNRACSDVGLQPTVYYYRKRVDAANEAYSNPAPTPTYVGPKRGSMQVSKGANSGPAPKFENKNVQALSREYLELQERLRELEKQISQAVISDLQGTATADT